MFFCWKGDKGQLGAAKKRQGGAPFSELSFSTNEICGDNRFFGGGFCRDFGSSFGDFFFLSPMPQPPNSTAISCANCAVSLSHLQTRRGGGTIVTHTVGPLARILERRGRQPERNSAAEGERNYTAALLLPGCILFCLGIWSPPNLT